MTFLYTVEYIIYLTNFTVQLELKADQPHLRNYLHMPTDYTHTDKHFRLVMTLDALCTDRHPIGQTDGQAHRETDTTKNIISLASWSLNMLLNQQKLVKGLI